MTAVFHQNFRLVIEATTASMQAKSDSVPYFYLWLRAFVGGKLIKFLRLISYYKDAQNQRAELDFVADNCHETSRLLQNFFKGGTLSTHV